MNGRWMAGVALVAALAMPSPGWAHEGHAHKVMGTVSSVDGPHLMVKTTDGKTVMVMLDAKTKITQGKAKLDAAALKVGDRVVAEGAEEKEMIMATSLQVGAVPAPVAAAKK
ncbi:MAG: hypothetical protein HY824_16340 [Acidobacteria bacterium]|nr:hypothetical protein [Acidobacteriota bacterium]